MVSDISDFIKQEWKEQYELGVRGMCKDLPIIVQRQIDYFKEQQEFYKDNYEANQCLQEYKVSLESYEANKE